MILCKQNTSNISQTCHQITVIFQNLKAYLQSSSRIFYQINNLLKKSLQSVFKEHYLPIILLSYKNQSKPKGITLHPDLWRRFSQRFFLYRILETLFLTELVSHFFKDYFGKILIHVWNYLLFCCFIIESLSFILIFNLYKFCKR